MRGVSGLRDNGRFGSGGARRLLTTRSGHSFSVAHIVAVGYC